jgi:hypothetical protein
MSWLVFSYSLPSTGRSSARVAVWRRLRALGAVSPKGGVHVLPERDECAEAFQWLVREVEQAKGEALLMRVERFEGLSDAQLFALFHDARKEDYAALDGRVAELEKTLAGSRNRESTDAAPHREAVARLRREYGDIARIDFFGSSAGAKVASRLLRVEQSLAPARAEQHAVDSVSLAAYRARRWVTRPGPYVDRLACAWLIRRFINPDAEIRYSTAPLPDEVAFDMSVGEFSHRGNLCTFETMMLAFGLESPAMKVVAEIVHDIDLRDSRYVRPEVPGVEAILLGWTDRADADREAHGIALFDGLHEAFSKSLGRAPKNPPRGAARPKTSRRRNAR